jgi:hypothetical protein
MDWAAARERLRVPMYAPLRGAIERLPTDRWPSNADLTALASGIRTSRGKLVAFVRPRETPGSRPRGGQPPADAERRYYELQIAESGEVETRAESWHDLFNALVWITFPRAKAAINAQHAAILEERGEAEAKRRSPERDALTLFDEGGVAVVADDSRIFERIVEFEWKDLFWNRRADLERHARFVAFGHALFEKALEPHLGIVAKTIFLSTGRLPDDDALVASVDASLAAHFEDRARFASPKRMAPMPVLGIPGWHPDTCYETFYDDPAHFRGRKA